MARYRHAKLDFTSQWLILAKHFHSYTAVIISGNVQNRGGGGACLNILMDGEVAGITQNRITVTNML